MGFFSWKTSDTNKSISNVYSDRGALPVYLLIPEEFGGGSIYEENYDGYGRFGGRDAYALLANWNWGELCNGNDEDDRMIGIKMHYECERNGTYEKYPLKFVEREVPYQYASASTDCEYQGFFYGDDEEDDDEEYYGYYYGYEDEENEE